MDAETLRIVLVTALAAAFALWVLAALVFRVSGTWERVLTDEEKERGARPERITFSQTGPFITGRRDVTGGHQEFSGFLIGRTLKLKRRDHGVPALMAQGFPEPIAKLLDGEVMAKLDLRLTEGGTHLVGSFTPQKVEFTHRPPRVTSAYFLKPQPRSYRRVIPIEVAEPKEAWDEITAEQPEAG